METQTTLINPFTGNIISEELVQYFYDLNTVRQMKKYLTHLNNLNDKHAKNKITAKDHFESLMSFISADSFYQEEMMGMFISFVEGNNLYIGYSKFNENDIIETKEKRDIKPVNNFKGATIDIKCKYTKADAYKYALKNLIEIKDYENKGRFTINLNIKNEKFYKDFYEFIIRTKKYYEGRTKIILKHKK